MQLNTRPTVRRVATRALMKAQRTGVCYLTESGREGEFVYDPAITIAEHQADTLEGIFVAPKPANNGAWRRVFSGPINVKWFGAKGDGATLDDDAIAAWLKFGFSHPYAPTYVGKMGSVKMYAPKGHYRWSRDALFSPNITTYGALICGDGQWNTIFVHDETASVGEICAVRNAGDGTMPSAIKFEALGFAGKTMIDAVPVQDRIRFWDVESDGYEQSFKFENVLIYGFNNPFTWSGNNVNSEVTFDTMEMVLNKGVLYTIQNPQAFNHDFINCNLIHGGTFFRSRSQPNKPQNLGSPSVRLAGGSMIMLAPPDGGICYFMQVLNSSVGVSCTPMVVSATRFEFRSEGTSLYFNAAGEVGDAVFNDCNFLIAENIPSWMTVDIGTIVTFNDCTLDTLFAQSDFRITLPSNTYGVQRPGEVYFNRCRMPYNTGSKILGITYGRAVATSCTTLDYTSQAVDGAPLRVVDFAKGPPTVGNPKMFPVQLNAMTPYFRAWPGSGGPNAEEFTIEFTIGETLDEIRMLKPLNNSGDETPVSFKIGSNDKSVVYAETNTGPFNQEHSIYIPFANRYLGDANLAKVRIWASNATSGRAAGGLIKTVTRG